MGYVAVPVLQIHCIKDEKIPFAHAQIIKDCLPRAPLDFPPLFTTEGGHNEIKETNHVSYYASLKGFVLKIASRQTLPSMLNKGLLRFSVPARHQYEEIFRVEDPQEEKLQDEARPSKLVYKRSALIQPQLS